MMSSTFSRSRSRCRGPVLIILSSAALLLTACASPPERFDSRARAAGLMQVDIEGSPFRHRIYARPPAPEKRSGVAIVYIDGDGLPWVRRGTSIADDPTPRRPLALELLLKTPLPAWYLTRPCYNGVNDKHCGPALWTSARYAPSVIESMSAALTRYSRSQGIERILLIGYSGGGVIAVLMAPRLENVVGVITVAANLDTAAWAAAHGYLPLEASLNPADQPAHTRAPIVHLIGERDTNVPAATLTRYIETHPGEEVWRYPDFDHVCCWAERWPEILEKALVKIGL